MAFIKVTRKIYIMTSWSKLISSESQKDYLRETVEYVRERRAEGVQVFPIDKDVFNAFDATTFDNVKVVILGQDRIMVKGKRMVYVFRFCLVLKYHHL